MRVTPRDWAVPPGNSRRSRDRAIAVPTSPLRADIRTDQRRVRAAGDRRTPSACACGVVRQGDRGGRRQRNELCALSRLRHRSGGGRTRRSSTRLGRAQRREGSRTCAGGGRSCGCTASRGCLLQRCGVGVGVVFGARCAPGVGRDRSCSRAGWAASFLRTRALDQAVVRGTRGRADPVVVTDGRGLSPQP